MKKSGKWVFSVFTKAIVIILVILLLPYARDFLQLIAPNVTGEILTQSKIIEQKLESSQRLEVTTVEEEGIIESKTNVIIFGTVGTTTIKYRYTASIGIDLKKVIMTPDGDRIIFHLPEADVLNDGIEAIEINRHNLFSKAIEKSVEALLAEQRDKCRNQFISEKEHSEKIRDDAFRAFHETVCKWLDSYGERHYEIEILYSGLTTAD